MIRRTVLAVVVAISWTQTAPLEGQVAWDGPLMVAPSSPLGWGLYLIDSGLALPTAAEQDSGGSGIGVMSTWRGGGRLGYRVGLAEDDLEEVAVFAGVDASGVFVAASDDFPIDVDWVTGVGFGVGDAFLLTVPLGLSAGRELQVEGILFNPYATPRVVLDAFFGGEVPGNDLELGFAVDLGMDLSFDPGWAVRFAGTVGDREALAIGFSFRFL